MLDIFTEVTGALDEIFFSSLNIFAFFATKDLFFLISMTSIKGNFLSKLSSLATELEIEIL